jgi:hypothetical protein
MRKCIRACICTEINKNHIEYTDIHVEIQCACIYHMNRHEMHFDSKNKK